MAAGFAQLGDRPVLGREFRPRPLAGGGHAARIHKALRQVQVNPFPRSLVKPAQAELRASMPRRFLDRLAFVIEIFLLVEQGGLLRDLEPCVLSRGPVVSDRRFRKGKKTIGFAIAGNDDGGDNLVHPALQIRVRPHPQAVAGPLQGPDERKTVAPTGDLQLLQHVGNGYIHVRLQPGRPKVILQLHFVDGHGLERITGRGRLLERVSP